MPYISQAYLACLDDDAYRKLLINHISMGYQPETCDTLLISQLSRFAGMSILGVQGSGKSCLVENLNAQDVAAGHAVIFIDPHGDSVDKCIARMSDDQLARTHVLDMTDEAYPFGLNVFAGNASTTSIAQAQAVDRIMHIFATLWKDVLRQQHLPRYLRGAVIALLANPGSTLVDMQRFLLDDDVRHRMLQAVTDPTVRKFWQVHYDDLPVSARLQKVEPLIGRLEALFMGRSLVRNIVGQTQNTIDFRKAIENKEIIFIKLPVKMLAQDARLIGTLQIVQIHAAVFSFSDLPQEQRPGVSLYVDEFQNFVTPDFAELFTEGRKFGARVTVAHQYRSQLPTYLQDSTMSAYTKICFRTTPDDAREMGHLFIGGEPVLQPEDINPHPIEDLRTYGSDDPNTQQFVDLYLRLLPGQIRGHSIEIITPGFRIEHVPLRMLNIQPSTDHPKVSDPTPFLNHLLYEVMKAGVDDFHIPPVIVYGFSNCGLGFFPAYRYALDKAALLSPEITFPPALVVETPEGNLRWTRLPESHREQLYHFLFLLRMTMRHLASEPIGKRSALSTTAIAHMLTQLPRRAAFVQSGDDVGVIYTEDTLPAVGAAELAQRLADIQQRTRQKYCRPKEELETAPAKNAEPVSDQPIAEEVHKSRWEELE